jgi:hypothetical protein
MLCFKYAVNMLVPHFISIPQVMLQVSVNSGAAQPLCFYFLLKHLMYCEWITMRVFVKSFGCAANLADGEVLAGCLAKAKCELADSASEADVLIYNTCAVKGPTENRVIAA